MAAHSPSTPVIQPVLPDQAPSAWPSWLREIAGAVNTLGAKTTELAAVPPGSGPAGPPGPTGPAGPPGATGSPGPPGSANMAGMTAGQIPIAASATSVTSSANLSGDITSNAVLATTLATVNATVGTFQGLTVNGKGLVTAAVDQGYALLAGGTLSTSASYAFPADGSANPYWLTGQLWQQTNPVNPPTTTNPHQESTMAILRHTPGAGIYGVQYGDAAVILGCDKLNYMTSTVEGEIVTAFIYNEQGRRGDSAGFLGQVTRVDDAAFPNYGSSFYESSVMTLSSAGVILRALHTLSGYVVTSPTSANTPVTTGYLVEARQGVNGVGYLVDTTDESGGTNLPSWQHAFMARTNRDSANAYFDVVPAGVTIRGLGVAGTRLLLNDNTAAPQAPPAPSQFQIAGGNGTSCRMVLDAYGVAVGNLTFRRANTSAAAPSAIQSGDALSTIVVMGYGTTGYSTGRTAINSFAAQTWTDANQGAYVTFETTPINTAARAEVLRLGHNGCVGVGTTGATRRFEVSSAGVATLGAYVGVFKNTHVTAGDSAVLIGAGVNGADTTSALVVFVDGSESALQGSITRNGAAAVAYNTASDERLKERIEPSEAGLETLLDIAVCDFNVKGDDRRVQGLIAQQLDEHYPVAVHVGGEDPLKDPWMIDYGRLTPLLIRAVQQQQAHITALEARLAGLEAR